MTYNVFGGTLNVALSICKLRLSWVDPVNPAAGKYYAQSSNNVIICMHSNEASLHTLWEAILFVLFVVCWWNSVAEQFV